MSDLRPAPRAEARPVFGWPRYAIFLTVVFLSALSPALPHSTTPDARWWTLAWLFIALMVLTGWLATRLPPGNWLDTLAPLLLYPAIWCLRAADGNAESGFSALILLPVIWFALYGRLRDVVIAIVAGELTALLPMLIIGPPQYPTATWRGSLLLVIVTAALGPLVYELVDTARRAHRALSRSETEFRAAFEDAPVGMAITGLNEGVAYHFRRVNRALCAMLGRSAEELTTTPITVFTHPDDVELTNYRFSVAADPNTPRRVEKRYLHKSGRVIWAAISYSVVRDENGEPTHLISQIEDISARHESDKALLEAVETDLAATERMHQLDKIRVEMASTVSHELRTPLTSAAGYVELLLEGDAGSLTSEQRTMLDTVARSLSRLDGIVDEVLSLADVEGSPFEPKDESADLERVVQSAVAAVSLQAATRGQDIVVHNDLDGAHTPADPGRIERVLVNLLSNAVKFTGDDGVITITAARENGCARIAVSDNGIGIAAEDQERIFERFYRATHVGPHKAPGTGLGLAIVQAITTQYGGTISVDSEPGLGSTFTLSLPLRAPAE
ncbi:MAG TPA: ATP-binding protein [Jatrophihabitantaceae bacterium]